MNQIPRAKDPALSFEVFEQAAYDEADMALDLAQYIGTEHHPMTFTATDFNDYPAIIHPVLERHGIKNPFKNINTLQISVFRTRR